MYYDIMYFLEGTVKMVKCVDFFACTLCHVWCMHMAKNLVKLKIKCLKELYLIKDLDCGLFVNYKVNASNENASYISGMQLLCPPESCEHKASLYLSRSFFVYVTA